MRWNAALSRLATACRLPRAVLVTAVSAPLLFPACAPPEPEPPTPEGVALRLFALADLDEPSADQLSACFEPPEDAALRAALLDALEALQPVAEVEVQRVEPLEGLDRVAVELTAPLEAGGLAHYSVQLAATGEGDWIVRWFSGPGVEWPRHRRPSGEGLTTSSPPRDEGLDPR